MSVRNSSSSLTNAFSTLYLMKITDCKSISPEPIEWTVNYLMQTISGFFFFRFNAIWAVTESMG